MTQQTKRILLVSEHNTFREALAARLSQEEDLEVTWQAGSLAEARNVHLNGVEGVIVDPLLPDGDGLVLIRELSVANPGAFALVLHKPDPAMHQQALGAGAAEVITTDASVEEVINAIRSER